MKSNARLVLIYSATAAILLLAAALAFPVNRGGLLAPGLALLLLVVPTAGILSAAAVERFVLRPAKTEVEESLRQSQEELELHVAERTEALQRNAERLGILHEIDQSLLAAQRPETIALAAIARIRRLVPCQRALVLALEKEGQLRVLAVQSAGSMVSPGGPDPPWTALYGELFSEPSLVHGQIYGVQDLGALARRSRLQQTLYEMGIHSYVVAPLLLDGEMVGTLNLESAAARSFTADHVTIAREVVTSLTVAIRQARLHARLQQELEERLEAEAILQRRTTALEIRNAELDAFAHTVAHDLKNPLTAIFGYASLLRNRRQQMDEETQDRYLDIVAQNTRKMTTIVDELLLLASVRAKDDIESVPLEMGRIVAEAQARLQYLVEELEGEIQVPEHWPVALGHPPWVEEVWANYISNALKYGGSPPRVELGFSIVDGKARGPAIKYWVRDNGPGLGPREQAALFTPFERLHQTRAEGHGLGLSIVQRIVQKLDGQVGVESSGQPGEGCTFYFTLPAHVDDEP